MAKRITRIKKGVESLKEEIEKHFEKIKEDITKGDLNCGRYHIKEIDKSLIKALELKMTILGDPDSKIIHDYKKRLDELKRSLN